MLAKYCLSEEFPILKLSDTVSYAIELMNENAIQFLPVVESKIYKGGFKKETLELIENRNIKLKDIGLLYAKTKIGENAHVLELMQMMATEDLMQVAIVDAEGLYIGMATVSKLQIYLNHNTQIGLQGGIIVIEVGAADFYFSELARIVEYNDARIIYMYLSPVSENGTIDVTLKINKEDLQFVISSLHRYEYKIKAAFHKSDSDYELQERLESFIRYLNI